MRIEVRIKFGIIWIIAARRRAIKAQKKKLKNLGKSKSTDTEEEEGEDEQGDGELYIARPFVRPLDQLLFISLHYSLYSC